jgi:hypothetical protein
MLPGCSGSSVASEAAASVVATGGAAVVVRVWFLLPVLFFKHAFCISTDLHFYIHNIEILDTPQFLHMLPVANLHGANRFQLTRVNKPGWWWWYLVLHERLHVFVKVDLTLANRVQVTDGDSGEVKRTGVRNEHLTAGAVSQVLIEDIIHLPACGTQASKDHEQPKYPLHPSRCSAQHI